MILRLVRPVMALALLVGAAVGMHGASAATAAACALSGTATISPGLTTKAQSESVTLSGVKLTNCHASTAALKSLSATVSTSPNPSTITASCASGNLALATTISWSDGTATTANITTKGVTASQTITGKVTSSNQPGLPNGAAVDGEVAFKPTTTSQNCATVPVTAVTFTGVLGS